MHCYKNIDAWIFVWRLKDSSAKSVEYEIDAHFAGSDEKRGPMAEVNKASEIRSILSSQNSFVQA